MRVEGCRFVSKQITLTDVVMARMSDPFPYPFLGNEGDFGEDFGCVSWDGDLSPNQLLTDVSNIGQY